MQVILGALAHQRNAFPNMVTYVAAKWVAAFPEQRKLADYTRADFKESVERVMLSRGATMGERHN